MGIRIDSPGGGGGGTTDHSALSNLDYSGSAHTGFEASVPTGTVSQFYRGDKTWQLVPDTGAGAGVVYAPTGATYIVQVASATLTNEQALADLSTGILKSTSGTGLVSIAVAGSDFEDVVPTGTTSQFYRGDKTWALVPDTGAGASVVYAPTGATYIVQVASATLTNEQALADLATGFLYSTSGTGVVTIPSPTATILLSVPAAKLPTATACAIDAGETNWRLLFDDTTNEFCWWQFRLPSNYSSTPVANILYSMTSATGGNLQLNVYVMAVTSGDTADINTESYATSNTSGNLSVATTAGYLSSATISLTNNDSLAGGDFTKIKLERNASGDTAIGDAEIVALSISYIKS